MSDRDQGQGNEGGKKGNRDIMPPTQENKGRVWTCQFCKKVNEGNNCIDCGAKRPQ